MPALKPDVWEVWAAWTWQDEMVWFGLILQVFLMQVAGSRQWTKQRENVLHKRILMDEVKTPGFQLVASVCWWEAKGNKSSC